MSAAGRVILSRLPTAAAGAAASVSPAAAAAAAAPAAAAAVAPSASVAPPPPRTGASAALRRRAALSAPPVTVTPAAAARLRALLARRAALPATGGVRLGVKTRGCNGMAYVMDYADAPAVGDEVVELPPAASGAAAGSAEAGGGAAPARLIVDGRCLMHILGTRVDWVDGRLASEFVFENPAAVGTCGCGESFNV